MATAFRTDRLATEGAIFDGLRDTVGAVAVVERAHDYQLCFTADGTGCIIDNMVTGVALVPALFNGDIFKSRVFFFEAELFRRPVHADTFCNRTDKIMCFVIPKNL